MAALDVLVTCRSHRGVPGLSLFPQVRGYYLAKHLRRSGLNAEFLPLPRPGLECEVLIWSEYESDLRYFQEHFEPLLRKVRARRMFGMSDIGSPPGFFSAEVGRWFGTQGGGGMLCHFSVWKLRSYERLIGLGVDLDAMPPFSPTRDSVIFDFPMAKDRPSWKEFDPATIAEVRRQLPGQTLVASGPDSFPYRQLFDVWWEYGRPHPEFAKAYQRAFAFVPGWRETMGLSVAEAQVCGASIVCDNHEILPEMTVSRFPYRGGDPASLARALASARDADPATIAEAARQRFDFANVVRLARKAIGLPLPSAEG
jgi:hypothetical protein